jgi:hypothetical protein
MSAEPRYREHDGVTVCEDCGAVIAIREAHNRFHSILSGHAWSLAVLKTAHLSAQIHDQYGVGERIDSKKFDSWSADALAEVTGKAPERPA